MGLQSLAFITYSGSEREICFGEEERRKPGKAVRKGDAKIILGRGEGSISVTNELLFK
jgi:hypothetical protein